MPATTRSSRKRERCESSSPKRSESSTAIGLRAEREDVAQDSADTGGRSLERLDRRGVVVALDLERDREPVADVDHAGVLARAEDHAIALGRKRPQQLLRVLVGAVLGPQQREDGELELVRVATEQLADAVELRVGQAERAGLVGEATIGKTVNCQLQAVLQQRLEELGSVGRAGERVDGVLGVGHQAEHVLARVGHARDVVQRPFGFSPGA